MPLFAGLQVWVFIVRVTRRCTRAEALTIFRADYVGMCCFLDALYSCIQPSINFDFLFRAWSCLDGWIPKTNRSCKSSLTYFKVVPPIHGRVQDVFKLLR